uniref:Uncharacterized protein n=1 Tax=Meloidogyne enterolobii TaxID=390850 RepID=A0A6V7VC49_MELEN|nr:unnamed protein product [Meloidogyne enterolobii]
MVQLEEGIKINIKNFGLVDKNTKNIKIKAEEIEKWTGDECLNEEEQKIAFEGQRLLLKKKQFGDFQINMIKYLI